MDVAGFVTGVPYEPVGHDKKDHGQNDAAQPQGSGSHHVQTAPQESVDTEPLAGAEEHRQDEQDETDTILAICRIILVTGLAANQGANPPGQGKQDLVP